MFLQDELPQQAQMESGKASMSDLHGGKRLGISTQDKIPLSSLVEKAEREQEEDARPGEADLDNSSKIPTMADCGKGSNCLHIFHPKQLVGFLGTCWARGYFGLSLCRSDTSRRALRDPLH